MDTDDLHEYGDTWINLDSVYHWHECECGAKADMTEHTFTWIIDKEATPTSTGLKHEECTECGYKRAAIDTYYEEPQPEPTEPEATQPEATEPQQTQPSGSKDDVGQEPGGNNAVIIIVIVAAVVVAVAVVLIVLKKKRNKR